MGCGVSSMGGGAERNDSGGPLPLGIRPLLRRRLEEMKKRSHASVLKGNQTLSKKELLGNVSSDDGDEIEEREGSLRSTAKVAPAPALERIEEQKEVIYQEKKQEEIKLDHENVKVEEEEEEEGRMSNFDERMICAGSPSFKVYCTHDVSDDDHHHHHDQEHQEKDGEYEKELTGNESVTVEAKEEGSIEKIEKKEKRGKRFRMALPRKYLATVAAPCYAGGSGGNGGGVGLGCMGNHNNHHSRIN